MKTTAFRLITVGTIGVVLSLGLRLNAQPSPRPPLTPLQTAAATGDLGGLKAMLSAGGPTYLNMPSAEGYNPLMRAAKEGQVEVVEWLLSQGADPNFRSSQGPTPLESAIEYPAASEDLIRSATDNVLAWTTRFIAEENLPRTSTTAAGASATTGILQEIPRATVLSPAMVDRKTRVVELLLAAGATLAPSKSPAETRKNLVLAAAPSLSGKVITLLVQAGANPKESDPSNGATPLHYAAMTGNLDAISALIAAGVDRDALAQFPVDQQGMRPGNGGYTPLASAVGAGQAGAVRLLLERGADVEKTNLSADRALHFAAGLGNAGITQLLLDHGARVLALDRWSASPLHYAATHGNLEVVKLLVEHRASLEMADSSGYTPLLDAIEENHLPVIEYLVSRSASLRVRTDLKKGPLRVAATAGAIDAVRFLIEHGENVDGQTGDTQKPLHEAVSAGFLEVVGLLLDKGAAPNVRDPANNNQTPLHVAVRGLPRNRVKWVPPSAAQNDSYKLTAGPTDEAFDKIVRLLLAHGADIDAADALRNTPLHYAAMYNDVRSCDFLLKLGANRELRNGSGSTPAQMASGRGYNELARFLNGQGPLPAADQPSQVRQDLARTLESSAPIPLSPEKREFLRQLLAVGAQKHLAADFTGAVASFTQAIELSPTDGSIYLLRAAARQRLNDNAGALADYDRNVTLAPSALGYLNRANLKGLMGDADGSLADATKAVDLDPNRPEAQYILGVSRLGKGEIALAIDALTRALALNPRYPEALVARGLARNEQREWTAALDDFGKALEINPASSSALQGRATARQQTGDTAGAAADRARAATLPR